MYQPKSRSTDTPLPLFPFHTTSSALGRRGTARSFVGSSGSAAYGLASTSRWAGPVWRSTRGPCLVVGGSVSVLSAVCFLGRPFSWHQNLQCNEDHGMLVL